MPWARAPAVRSSRRTPIDGPRGSRRAVECGGSRGHLGGSITMRPRLSHLAAVPLLAGLLGCGADNGLTLGRVRGTVTYEGQPVTYGQVMFVPDDSKGTNGPAAMSMINRDGSFDMSTEEAGDGVVVGQHKVAIV